MRASLDLGDIQGNILQGYGRFGFPHVRYFVFHFENGAGGRKAVLDLLPYITSSARWDDANSAPGAAKNKRPKVTLNIAFTWQGMAALGVPIETLIQFPPTFVEGMPARCMILSDTGASGPNNWDPIWRDSAAGIAGRAVHMLVTLNAQTLDDAVPVPELAEMTELLRNLGSHHGVKLLSGHGKDALDYQQAGGRMVAVPGGKMIPDSKEHFGYADGVGDPVFEGQYPAEVEKHRVHGRGKLMPDQTWKPLAAGEFLIGYPDESQELPHVVRPPAFVRNGTFLVYRKLHENVRTFDDYIADRSKVYARVRGVSEAVANLTLRAKMVGRWPNGVPLAVAPTHDDMLRFDAKWADIPLLQAKSGHRTAAENERLADYDREMIEFRFRDDPFGVRCPVGAHLRRANMRDMLDPQIKSPNPRDWDGSALSNRRRILRRGLPYGPFDPPQNDDSVERGVIFVALCTDLFRQFEFVQQQWINFGMDASVGNDTCPLLGEHDETSKFVIQSDPEDDVTPWILDALPQFVTMRGGEYFFVPGINSLNMIAKGLVDPT